MKTKLTQVYSYIVEPLCEKCESVLVVDKSTRYLSSPPKYDGYCKQCDKTYYVEEKDCSQIYSKEKLHVD